MVIKKTPEAIENELKSLTVTLIHVQEEIEVKSSSGRK